MQIALLRDSLRSHTASSFRKEAVQEGDWGLVTQRNNIKSHYPAFELMGNPTHITSRDRNLAHSICGAKEKQLPTQHTKDSPPHRENLLQHQTLQQEVHRPGPPAPSSGLGLAHLTCIFHLDAAAISL